MVRRYVFSTIVVAVVLALVAVGCSSKGHATTTTTTTIPAPTVTAAQCDDLFWAYTYAPTRLHVSKPCVTIQGIAKAVKMEGDGDVHIDVAVDPASQKAAGVRPYLVTEIVCNHTPTNLTALKVCEGYRSHLFVPKVGQHVQETGPYALDVNHNDWEIHPINTIKVL